MLLTLSDRPWPADGGKRMRACAVLRVLAALDVDLDVVVLFAGPPIADPLPPGVHVRECRQIDAPPRRRPIAVLVAAARVVPWQIAVFRWGRVRAALPSVRRRTYDLVWFGATDHAVSLRGFVRAAHTVVDMDDVEVPKLRTFLALPRDRFEVRGKDKLQRRIELPLWRRVQRRVARQADALIVCSDLDRSRLGGSGNVAVVPNGYTQPSSRLVRSTAQPPVVIFVATYFYPPNVDAAGFAARQMLPLLRKLVPDARLRLVGRGGKEKLSGLRNCPGVEVIGAVPDVSAELSRAHVCIAPIRYGGGTRVKILEAFAWELPVVSTTLGCEGLDVDPNVHLLVADEASGLARACATLITDDHLADRITTAAVELYRARYRETAVQDAIHRVAAGLLWPR